MADFDITPPPVPGKRKDGFLKKFFFKEEKSQNNLDDVKKRIGLDEEQHMQQAPMPPPDLEEIRQKLGLDDDLLAQPAPMPKPALVPAPTEKVEIHDWTQDATPIPTSSPSSNEMKLTTWDLPASPKASTKWDAELDITKDEIAIDELNFDDPKYDDPLHHDAVDKHLEPIAKQQEKVEKTLLLADMRPEVPAWKLQEKEITPEQYFILRNGQPVKSLKELIDAMEYIDDSTFSHHVNEYRNDFANWIRDVIGDNDLANAIEEAETKPEMVKALLTHEKTVAKEMQKEHSQMQQVVKKREQTMKKLQTVEDQIQQLKSQLEQKTKELTGERKAKASLIKEKLDAEVNKRLSAHKQSLVSARAELAKAKRELQLKAQAYDTQTKALAEREKALMLAEQKNKQLLEQVKEQRAALHAEKQDASSLLKDAQQLRKQWEEMKKLDLQTKQNLEIITKREIELSRHEETLRQREKKVTADLTKTHEAQERTRELLAQQEQREIQVKKMEADARAMVADAQARSKEALETERVTRDRIKADLKKMEMLRKQIDTSLAKVLKNKQKISNAVALRKHLEEHVLQMRTDVAQDRKDMEEESFGSFLETQKATTAVGQPDASRAADVLDVSRKQLPIYAKVEACREALDRHDLQKAKQLYSELRQEFTTVKMPAAEKSVLYTSIRELYDDLHLALLG